MAQAIDDDIGVVGKLVSLSESLDEKTPDRSAIRRLIADELEQLGHPKEAFDCLVPETNLFALEAALTFQRLAVQIHETALNTEDPQLMGTAQLAFERAVFECERGIRIAMTEMDSDAMADARQECLRSIELIESPKE